MWFFRNAERIEKLESRIRRLENKSLRTRDLVVGDEVCIVQSNHTVISRYVFKDIKPFVIRGGVVAVSDETVTIVEADRKVSIVVDYGSTTNIVLIGE